MILFTALAVIGAAHLISSLIDMFYDDIIKWIRNIGQIAKKVVQGALIGCKVFINVVRATLRTIGKEISKNYSKVGDKWQVTEISRNVPPDEIPDEIYQRSMQINSNTVEVTRDIEAQMLKNYQ